MPTINGLPIQTGTPVGNENVAADMPDGTTIRLTTQQIADLSAGGAVASVNGQTGVVVLDAADVAAVPTTVGASPSGAEGDEIVVVLKGSIYVYLTTQQIANLGGGGGGGAGTKTYGVFGPWNSQPPAASFATLDTRNSIAVLDFDDTTSESVFWVSVMPEAANLSLGLIAHIKWAATSATTGNVTWGVQFERMTTDMDADSYDTAAVGTTACSGTNGIPSDTAITITTIDSIVAGDMYRVKVYRDAAAGTDTMAGDAELVSVEIRSAA